MSSNEFSSQYEWSDDSAPHAVAPECVAVVIQRYPSECDPTLGLLEEIRGSALVQQVLAAGRVMAR